MGLFSSKKKEVPKLPPLPEIPNVLGNLPPRPGLENFHELPTFPTTKTGEKFSQNAIKNAIVHDPDTQNPPLPNIPETKLMQKPNNHQKEPVFIRLDHFEEGLKIFNETKELIRKVERLLNETRELKAKEEDELNEWENEIQEMKEKIDKVNQDIFSKI